MVGAPEAIARKLAALVVTDRRGPANNARAIGA
jgi:hypothetical protein